MKSSVFDILLRVLIGALSLLLLITAACETVADAFGLGAALSVAIGAVLGVLALCPKRRLCAVPQWIRWSAGSVLLLVCGFFIFLFVFGRFDSVTNTEDAIVVLGCRVRGTEPSKSLQNRLDRAVAYHRANPAALIVVSGGKGDDEDCSEAEAMSTYLQRHGVPASSILLEDRSTSTAENFRFSKPLLDAHFERPYTVAFITNDYHILRASFIARQEGYGAVTHAAAPTPFRSMFAGGLRETCAIAAHWLHL